MKQYKVNVKVGKDVRYSKYFLTRNDARAYRNILNTKSGFSASVGSKSVEVVYHHSALQRGYQCKENVPITTYYNGRFGVGYIKHIPNAERKVSNEYHYIEYYIEK